MTAWELLLRINYAIHEMFWPQSVIEYRRVPFGPTVWRSPR